MNLDSFGLERAYEQHVHDMYNNTAGRLLGYGLVDRKESGCD